MFDALSARVATNELHPTSLKAEGRPCDALTSWKSGASAPRQTAFEMGFSTSVGVRAHADARRMAVWAERPASVIRNAALEGLLFHRRV
jgi:hypothetical protein